MNTNKKQNIENLWENFENDFDGVYIPLHCVYSPTKAPNLKCNRYPFLVQDVLKYLEELKKNTPRRVDMDGDNPDMKGTIKPLEMNYRRYLKNLGIETACSAAIEDINMFMSVFGNSVVNVDDAAKEDHWEKQQRKEATGRSEKVWEKFKTEKRPGQYAPFKGFKR